MATKIIILSLLINIIKSNPTENKCQQITIPMCKGIGYNFTQMPNPFNHDTQDEAGLEVHQYWPLVEIKCSSDLRFFICSLYVPICMEDYKGSVPVCRSVCERARIGCEPVMTQYGFQWPERMDCKNFPKYGKTNICMDQLKGEVNYESPRQPVDLNHCKSPLVKKTDSNVNLIQNCSLPCRIYTQHEEIHFANWWISLWSGLCCFITFVTLITFLIDTNRFPYPERPIVYLSSCYCLVSIGYLIRILKGHEEIACAGDSIINANPNLNCVLVFVLIYYFGLASSIWWVLLSLTWYLAAGCKWGSEAISKHYKLFHFCAWVGPAVPTLIAILLDDKAVDGDPVAGICLIGNQDPLRLLIYSVAPLSLLLIMGTSFLLAGFIALFRIRQVISRQTNGRSKTEKLEKLMIRIGVFSVLYTLPASAVIAANFYEIKSKQLWIQDITNDCKSECNLKPIYSVIMIKYFMSLAVGITTGVWIWSGKTIETWQLFIKNVFCCKKQSKYNEHEDVNKLTHV